MPGAFRNVATNKKKLIPLVGVLLGLCLVAVSVAVLTRQDRVYGLMIDAGSTGSRMHTFVFTKGSENNLQLITEDFFALKPGLSNYKEDAKAASESLDPLLARSRSIVPEHLHSSTPVYLRATAGLRMLGPELSENILREVRSKLKNSGFRFDSDNWASILGGNDEGIYSWITVNYLLNRAPSDTAGTLEMGGGSSQIAFVPREPNLKQECNAASESIQYKGADLGLYTVSHLNFGLKKAKADVLKSALSSKAKDHPCLNEGVTSVEIPFEDPPTKAELRGVGSFAACINVIDEVLMAGAGECNCGICTYRGEPQPPATRDYVALAFYAERTTDLGLKNPVTMRDIRALGEKICKMSLAEVKARYPVVPNGEAADLCFDLAFIYQHLTDGHGIKEAKNAGEVEPKIQMVKKINGIELGWSLGAMFAEMSKLESAN
mmetsp:Transcript_2169/g.6461  ORF Transcript_2169/g.6461 Transcript_2169/m.6461 type:complete len:435 (+) Transcript_2169:340-1644(+)|eukprot:CAMPEP_0198726350 /NCGR_PEP_ID=MMETSP1475-20131203/3416_1 /TAXON_ID= ORGANISM="Unidentified sp., Strain CCMP1999" /NCGR_SAMPLE_ID=MMETSP1475 /ASSEMBLY_ACC=CAM_ASM_001111 /LENGTH=434 /DNA_ID=CAMNT_0044488257 /DNA_START=338 /DNA_END=1642 /DNA_ORIENTATION=+